MRFSSSAFIRLVVLLVTLNLSVFSVAKWSEPVFLSELNDEVMMQTAVQPGISSDGLSLFFVRQMPSYAPPYFIVEAQREGTETPFLSQTVLTYLGQNRGSYIASPRVSQDGLRLYYVEAISYKNKWQNLICMATRRTPLDSWSHSRIFTELHSIERDSSPSLTGDELTIMWLVSDPTVTSETRIYTATRSSRASSFGNIREVVELNVLQAQDPFMTANGLSVYFVLPNDEGYFQLWRGTRDSLDGPFGNFARLDDINQPDMNFRNPCVSPDEEALYFYRGAPWMDASEKGIYVSDWLSNYEVAVINLLEAKDLKQQAQELINLAIEKETEAVKALSLVKPDELPAGVKMQDVRLARVGVLQAVQRQVIARMNINAGLELLNKVLLRIMPPAPVVQEEISSETKRAVPEQAETKSAAARNSKK